MPEPPSRRIPRARRRPLKAIYARPKTRTAIRLRAPMSAGFAIRYTARAGSGKARKHFQCPRRIARLRCAARSCAARVSSASGRTPDRSPCRPTRGLVSRAPSSRPGASTAHARAPPPHARECRRNATLIRQLKNHRSTASRSKSPHRGARPSRAARRRFCHGLNPPDNLDTLSAVRYSFRVAINTYRR